jgi:hypothetical protein
MLIFQHNEVIRGSFVPFLGTIAPNLGTEGARMVGKCAYIGGKA